MCATRSAATTPPRRAPRVRPFRSMGGEASVLSLFLLATATAAVSLPLPRPPVSSSSLAAAAPSFYALTATLRDSGSDLVHVGFATNTSSVVGSLPPGEVVSNGGGGVALPAPDVSGGLGSFALVTSRLASAGRVTYQAMSVRLEDGGVDAGPWPIPQIEFVQWDGFGIRSAVDQRDPGVPRLAVLAPTSNISDPGEPTQRFDFGLFVIDLRDGSTSQVLALQGNPISAGGASAFDSARGTFWFVLGDLALVQRVLAVDVATAALTINKTLVQPPGLALLAWDSHTRDMFSVGVTPETHPVASRFVVQRLDGDSGEVVSSISLDEEAAAAGWRTLRTSNIAMDSSARTLYFLVGGVPPLMQLNWLTLVAVNVETGAVSSVKDFCRSGSPREGIRNCPTLIGQATAGAPRRGAKSEDELSAAGI